MFFVSSRRRHTRWPRDWSSDVCSSDLYERENIEGVRQERAAAGVKTRYDFDGKGRVEYETQGSLMAVWNKTQIKGISQRQERSEEHTSELQSRGHLVCRLLLEKKKERRTR